MQNLPNSKVLIADDHPAVAHLLAEFVRRKDGYEVVGLAHDGQKALDMALSLSPDIIILDLGLPKLGGLEVLGALGEQLKNIKVLVFSAISSPAAVQAAFEQGATGFVEKSAPYDVLAGALDRIRDGQTVIGPEASTAMRELVKQGSGRDILSASELAILRLLNEGINTKEIASRVNLSVSGVYKVIDRIKTKTGATSPRDLTMVAMRYGITSLPIQNDFK